MWYFRVFQRKIVDISRNCVLTKMFMLERRSKKFVTGQIISNPDRLFGENILNFRLFQKVWLKISDYMSTEIPKRKNREKTEIISDSLIYLLGTGFSKFYSKIQKEKGIFGFFLFEFGQFWKKYQKKAKVLKIIFSNENFQNIRFDFFLADIFRIFHFTNLF